MRNFTILYIVFLVCSFIENGNAQIVIGKPNLGFSQACASPSFNTYNITFTFSPEAAISSTNQFKIELSDATGNFSNATTIYTSGAGTISASPATLSFPVPITISGEAYKLRVKSTAPVATSANSNAFAAYYKIQDTPFSINNLISTGVYCSGGSYLLTIDNPGNESNDSPLQYPALTYNWFKETSPTTSDFIALGETLSVSEPGTYFVETNYGTCTSNSFSNRVTVSESTSGGSSSINSSKGNPFCSSKGPTTLSAINGMSYQWFKDGIEISGATDQMYNTDISGAYSVNIDLGSCTTSAMINLESTGFTSSIDVEAINTIEENETLVATVTTSANNPEYIWYFNDTLIPDAISNRYVISQTGNYKAVIRQTTGCMVSREFVFEVRTPFPDVANIPNVISPNGDGINDTWIIPQDYVNGTNAEIMVLNSKGDVVFQTIDYQNNWPENQIAFAAINPVYYYIITTVNGNVKKGSITVVK